MWHRGEAELCNTSDAKIILKNYQVISTWKLLDKISQKIRKDAIKVDWADTT